MDKRSSALVAPLSIHKSPIASLVDVFAETRQSSPRGSISNSQSHMSPPPTPRSSHYETGLESFSQPMFHNYLRAFYHYNPSSTISASNNDSSVTVALRQGDVILVHSVHPNGWADGTLLATGARGWLPTNYCEPYHHPSIRNLLDALCHLWDLVRAGENGDVSAFARQDYVRTMIAGVRFFLERTACLSRDSRLIVAHVGLRRMRKGLLGDLSSLVKTAKNLQESLQADDVHVLQHMDDVIVKSFKLVTRAVRFLDIWATDSVSLSSFDLGDINVQRPLTPPSDFTITSIQTQAVSDPVGDVTAIVSNREVAVVPETRDNNQSQFSAHLCAPKPSPSSRCSRQSVVFSLPPDSDALPRPLLYSPPTQHKANQVSITHRFSYTAKSHGSRNSHFASEQLNMHHDAFLGFIASFIGLHLQSRSSDELTQLTRQSVSACQKLIGVVEEIWDRDLRRSQLLAEARDNMLGRIADLVSATKHIFTLTDAEEAAEVIVDAGKQLVDAGTSCVRAAGDCVSRARLVIESMGDFEYEPTAVAASESAASEAAPVKRAEVVEIVQPQTSQSLETTVEIERISPDPTKQPVRPVQVLPVLAPLIIADTAPLLGPPQLFSHHIPSISESPIALSFRSSVSSTPGLSALSSPVLTPPSSTESLSSPLSLFEGSFVDPIKIAGLTSNSPYNFSKRSAGSVISQTSTRPSTPEHMPHRKQSCATLMSSFGSSSELRSLASEDACVGEVHLMETSYAHELVYNKEGQISGGSLPALVEQLTTHESTPDIMFVTAFYLTFRLFTTPLELAQCLIDRFDYAGRSMSIGVPVRLRVYNVFKGWLESHWSGESDSCALDIILGFATGKLNHVMPTEGRRLAQLTTKVTQLRVGALVPRLVSSIGKTGISNVVFTPSDTNVPSSNITKSQLNALRACKEGKSQCSILDFDPLELARQFTIIESKLFCAIQPEELLALEWTKKTDSKAHNVKAMSTLSTDLANLVADTILSLEDAKKRAVVIKQWVKIAMKCLELNNYDSLMAIICSLNSSMVLRLKRTWELVSNKTKARLEDLKTVTDVGRNYAVLRQRLHNHVAPCLPFVGIYLTDLTFVDVGNGTTRQLPGGSGRNGASVINYDKHMKTAKIIGQMQSFQVPYRLAAIPEMQDWMEMQIQRVRSSDEANVQSYYRRSLLLEPREMQHSLKGSPSIDNSSYGGFTAEKRTHSRERLDFLNFNFSQKS